jgi:pimeloyl-ACP methyl ester carboxylesterase
VVFVELDALKLAYREAGSGPPVLLLHGWPTSSFLWREVMKPIARRNRVLALDLPAFGESDKPLEESYGFDFFESAIDGFLESLGIDQVAIGGHDVGGPIALHWALKRPERVTKVALLNTLVYPEFSEAVLQFIHACSTPEIREQLTSPAGLEAAIRLGVADDSKLDRGVFDAVSAPFASEEARLALAKAGIGLEPAGFEEIARRLPSLEVPLRVVYGEQDRILPDVAETMARVKHDVPHAEVTAMPACGHFLQEEEPEEIGELLADFFARS